MSGIKGLTWVEAMLLLRGVGPARRAVRSAAIPTRGVGRLHRGHDALTISISTPQNSLRKRSKPNRL
jgi:hypothetical protein